MEGDILLVDDASVRGVAESGGAPSCNY